MIDHSVRNDKVTTQALQ